MSLKTNYRFIAPIYDAFIERATRGARQRSLSLLPQQGAARVLVSGAGTGLDFPFLPPCHDYTALDFTAAMLARQRAWLRRSLSPLVGRMATRLDVVFEDVLETVPGLHVISDQPALVRGWFRLIELQKE